jgi:arginine repressor
VTLGSGTGSSYEIVSKNRERFVRLAESRVTKAIRALRLVGNLSNKNNYSYTAEDAQKITSALERELRDLRRRFDDHGPHDQVRFRL